MYNKVTTVIGVTVNRVYQSAAMSCLTKRCVTKRSEAVYFRRKILLNGAHLEHQARNKHGELEDFLVFGV